MSETIRSYKPAATLRRHRRPRRRGGRGVLLLLAAIILLACAVAWFTRDSFPFERVIPADQKYSVVLVDILGNRKAMAGSAVWRALPDMLHPRAVTDALGGDAPVPDWVLNNLVGETCYVTGNDLNGMSDVLFITRMYRGGRILEALHRFVPGIVRDEAGGLHLRQLTNGERDLYYAIRGRLLVLSPSRDMLIRCLTLPREEMSDAETVKLALAQSGSEQVRGIVAPGSDDPLGDVFQHLSFALRLDTSSARLKCNGLLRPEYSGPLPALLTNAAPRTLSAPPNGIVEISANFDCSLKDVCAGIGKGLQWDQAWTEWQAGLPEKERDNANRLAALLGLLGPEIRLSWRGVDLNEIVPVPELVAQFEANPEVVRGFFATLGPPPDSARPWESYPRYDPENGRVRIPMIGGPSIEPTLGVYGDTLLVSTSATVAGELLATEPVVAELPQPANLYVRVDPLACAETCAEVGRLLCEEGLLRGHTIDTFESVASQWTEKASFIREVTAILAKDGEGIAAEVTVRCTGS